MIVAGLVLEPSHHMVLGGKGDQTTSSPPETAQDRDSLEDETPVTTALEMPPLVHIRN